MNIEKLSRLDLNLLGCLQVLMEELSVTRTAHRLCLSQSAVSKSLAKLREQFNDPLFTRSAHGLRPTPKAVFLKPRLETLISLRHSFPTIATTAFTLLPLRVFTR